MSFYMLLKITKTYVFILIRALKFLIDKPLFFNFIFYLITPIHERKII